MRTTVIPAQITTVEDRIAGSLSMTQVIILMVPVFFATIMFAIFPPTMHIVLYKLPPVFIVLLISLLLSLRIKGKVVMSWLLVLASYNLRPKYYVFKKSDAYLRNIPRLEKTTNQKIDKPKKELLIPAKSFGLTELKQLKKFIKNPDYSFSIKPGKKGGLYVAVSEIQN